MTDTKIGVFICQCGDNISSKIGIGRLKNAIQDDNVIFIEKNPYICSLEGQNKIKEKIESSNVDRIVIAACSPKIHEKEFRRCAENAGINKYLLEVANIREQCAWIDKDPDSTSKAIDILNSSIYAIKKAVPHEKINLPVVKSALVIGGGISGITAALSLARQNIKVYIVEKSPTIGGNMVKIGKVFSADTLSEECAMCSLGPLMGEVAENPNIDVFPLSQVTSASGHAGNFMVKISTGPKLVDEEKCISCGECSRICRTNTPDEWNANLSGHTAAYKPFAQAIPSSYTIDNNACVKCGACIECPTGAINLDNPATETTLNVGAITIATGYQELNPEDKEEFGYKNYHDVITQMELARILAVNGPTSGKLQIPSTGKKPQRVVMVQCVGSRDRKPGSIPHCSTICCMTALKHANYIINHYKGVEIYICYTDMRTPGTYENYYFETQKKGEKTLKFVRGKVAEVKRNKDGKMVARVEDTLGGGVLDIENDMIVLSCALEPSESIMGIEKALGVSLTPEMFVKEKYPKMEPTQTTVPGIFVAGTAKEAMDVTASINMSRSAALQVAELLRQGNIEIEPNFVVIDYDKCEMCGECIKFCHSGAIYVDGKVQIDPIACSGCGGCMSKCKHGSISLPLSNDDNIFARIEGYLSTGTPAILAFLDKDIAYTAADNMGANRLKYPSEVRIIKIPSILRLELKHILYAFEMGAAGIFLGDGTGNVAGNYLKERLAQKVEELKEGASLAGIDPERIFFYNAYLPHYKGLASKLKGFSELIEDKELLQVITLRKQRW